MSAHENNEHQASDNLYNQVTSASQVTQISARAVHDVSHGTGNSAAHAYQGLKGAVKHVKYGAPTGPKLGVRGRLSRRLFQLRRGLKNTPKTAVKGVGKGVKKTPGAYVKGANSAVSNGMRGMESSDDELTQISARSTRGLSRVPAGGVKTIRTGVKGLKTACKSFKRAQLAAKQVKYARSTMQTIKAVIQMVASGLSSIGVAFLPILGILVAAVAAIAFIFSFFTGQASACTVQTVASANFGATSGKLDGLQTSQSGMHTIVNYQAMGVPSTWFDNDTSAYQFQQCTWWVANRWKTLGLKVDHHMGNGVDWASSAKKLGYPTGDTPRLGAIVSMAGGVLSASLGPYGHVAVVEQIDADGSIWVSESGTSIFAIYNAPVVDHITKVQLDVAKGGYTYIYSTGSTPSDSASSSQGDSTSYASMGCPINDSGDTGAASSDAKSAQEYAKKTMKEQYDWGDDEYQALLKLWNKESGWNYQATNKSSGAYGIPQSLPADKMASMGADWKTNPHTQINWGLKYIKDRYGTPSKAWEHSQQTNWY